MKIRVKDRYNKTVSKSDREMRGSAHLPPHLQGRGRPRGSTLLPSSSSSSSSSSSPRRANMARRMSDMSQGSADHGDDDDDNDVKNGDDKSRLRWRSYARGDVNVEAYNDSILNPYMDSLFDDSRGAEYQRTKPTVSSARAPAVIPWGLTDEELKEAEGDSGDPSVFRIIKSTSTDDFAEVLSDLGKTEDGTTQPKPQEQPQEQGGILSLSPEEVFVAKCRILVCLATPGLLVQLPLYSKYATYACVLGPYVENLGLQQGLGLGLEGSDEAKVSTDGMEVAVGEMEVVAGEDIPSYSSSSSSSSSASSSSTAPSSSSSSTSSSSSPATSSAMSQRIVVFDGERNRIVLASECSSLISDDAFLGELLVSTTHIYLHILTHTFF